MKGVVQGSPANKGQNLNLNPGLLTWGFPGGSDGKESACNVGDLALSWVGKIPWRRESHPTSVFLLGEPQGQMSLTGYSPRGPKSQTRLSDEHFTFSWYEIQRPLGPIASKRQFLLREPSWPSTITHSLDCFFSFPEAFYFQGLKRMGFCFSHNRDRFQQEAVPQQLRVETGVCQI